jgi:hypothetical protein
MLVLIFSSHSASQLLLFDLIYISSSKSGQNDNGHIKKEFTKIVTNTLQD